MIAVNMKMGYSTQKAMLSCGHRKMHTHRYGRQFGNAVMSMLLYVIPCITHEYSRLKGQDRQNLDTKYGNIGLITMHLL